MKPKVPAKQRHHRERAARARWLAISQVLFLYGLPTYIEDKTLNIHRYMCK